MLEKHIDKILYTALLLLVLAIPASMTYKVVTRVALQCPEGYSELYLSGKGKRKYFCIKVAEPLN